MLLLQGGRRYECHNRDGSRTMGRRTFICGETLWSRCSCISSENHYAAEAIPLLPYAYIWCGCARLAFHVYTRAGKDIITRDPNHPGSLGTAISEAIELATTTPGCKYTLGSVLNHVALHQTIIGLEAEKQMEMAGEYPDKVIACFGGGSNFGGVAFPFMRHVFDGTHKDTEFIAAEPESCPKLTRGKFEYDFGDEAGYTPLLPMFTLGHDFKPANIHAGGLRYHGAGVIISQLVKDGYMHGVDIPQLDSFKAGMLFAQTEGIVPAPESCHAIAATVREALRANEEGKAPVILFNLSGHGLIDMPSYMSYIDGDLMNYRVTDAEIEKNLKDVPYKID